MNVFRPIFGDKSLTRNNIKSKTGSTGLGSQMSTFNIDHDAEQNRSAGEFGDKKVILGEDKQNSSGDSKSFWSKLHAKLFSSVKRKTVIEVIICSAICLAVFVVSLTHFLNQSVQTLVPSTSSTSTKGCAAVLTLAAQKVEISFPAVVKFVDYNEQKAFTAHGNFAGSYQSCSKQSIDSDGLQLQPDMKTYFQPLQFPLSANNKSDPYVFNSSVSSNDGCFKLSCGFSYYSDGKFTNDSSGSFNPYLNNTLIMTVLGTVEEDVVTGDGTPYFTNSQLVLSMTVSHKSVSAMCGVGLLGDVTEVLSESNSVASSGTYLCTTYTTTYQALSSALSLTLTAIGVCRIYFMVIEFMETF